MPKSNKEHLKKFRQQKKNSEGWKEYRAHQTALCQLRRGIARNAETEEQATERKSRDAERKREKRSKGLKVKVTHSKGTKYSKVTSQVHVVFQEIL